LIAEFPSSSAYRNGNYYDVELKTSKVFPNGAFYLFIVQQTDMVFLDTQYKSKKNLLEKLGDEKPFSMNKGFQSSTIELMLKRNGKENWVGQSTIGYLIQASEGKYPFIGEAVIVRDFGEDGYLVLDRWENYLKAWDIPEDGNYNVGIFTLEMYTGVNKGERFLFIPEEYSIMEKEIDRANGIDEVIRRFNLQSDYLYSRTFPSNR